MKEAINIRAMLGGGFLVLLVAMGIGRFAYTPLLPPMMSEYAFGAEEAGLLASFNYLGYLVGAFGAGALCRIWGEKRLLLFGLFLSVLTTAGTGFPTAYPLVSVMRLLAGVASAFCFVAVSGMVLSALAREGHDGLAGWFYGGVGTGIVLSGFLAVPLVDGFGAAGAWIALGALSGFLGWSAFRLLPQGNDPSKQGKVQVRVPFPRSGCFYRIVAAYGLEGFGYIITGTFLVTAAQTTFDSAGAASVWIVAGLASIPSALFWSRTTRRYGTLRPLVAAYLLQAVGIVLPVFFPHPAGVILGAILFGGTFMGIVGLALASGGNMLPAARGRVIGLMTGIYGIGQIIGPSFAGAIAARTGSFDLSLIVAALAVLAGAILLAPDAFRK